MGVPKSRLLFQGEFQGPRLYPEFPCRKSRNTDYASLVGSLCRIKRVHCAEEFSFVSVHSTTSLTKECCQSKPSPTPSLFFTSTTSVRFSSPTPRVRRSPSKAPLGLDGRNSRTFAFTYGAGIDFFSRSLALDSHWTGVPERG